MHNFNIKIKIAVKIVIFLIILSLSSELLLMFEIPSYSQYTRLMMNDMYNTKKADIVFLGSSKVYSCINPYIAETEMGVEAFNLASPGQKMIGSYYLLKEFINNLDEKPQNVILDLQPTTFNIGSNKDTFEDYIITDYMQKGVNYWDFFFHAYTPNYWFEAFSSSYHYRDKFNLNEVLSRVKGKYYKKYFNYEYLGEYIGKGYRITTKSIGNDVDIENANITSFVDSEKENINISEMNYFNKIVNLCKENNIELTLITLPAVDYVYYDMKNPEKVRQFYNDLAQKNDLQYFDLNLNKFYCEIKDNRLDFYDSAHMNDVGAEKLTSALAITLKKLGDTSVDLSEDYFKNYAEWFNSKKDESGG